MAKITGPNRQRFLHAKRNRQAKIAKLREAYAKASGATREEILDKAIRVNKHMTRDAFIASTGK